MSTAYPDLFRALAQPFPRGQHEGCVKVLPKAGGKPYITARMAMNRLDDVLGPENWKDEYQWLPGQKAILCRLSIRLPDGRWLTKADAGARSQTGDEGVDDMGAASDALKRAAVKFGIARELYGDGVAMLDVLPSPRPDTSPPADQSPVDLEEPATSRKLPVRGPLGSGKALYAWLMAATNATGLDLVGLVRGWAQAAGSPTDMANWDIGLVTDAQAFVAKHLDGRGLLDIPPEARAQMAKAPEASIPPGGALPARGPLTIHRKDPLAELKLKVIEVARPVAEAFFGQEVSEIALRDYLVVRAREHGLEPITDLRNCSDRKAIERLLSALYQDAADSRVLS